MKKINKQEIKIKLKKANKFLENFTFWAIVIGGSYLLWKGGFFKEVMQMWDAV